MFDGFSDFVALLQELVSRPGRGELPRRDTGSGPYRRWGLPMVCLIRDAVGESLLPDIAKYLTNARPTRVPHVLYRFPPDETAEAAAAPDRPAPPEVTYDDLDAVAKVLNELATQLSTGPNTTQGRIRFNRFRLGYWLMHQPAGGHGGDIHGAGEADSDILMLRRLRRRDILRRREPVLAAGGTAVAEILPWWAKALVAVVPPVWFRLKLRFGAQYRWYLRQPYLAPRDPGTFVGFAERLAGSLGPRPEESFERSESPKELLALLVNAFLADVRHAYRRHWWRPSAARRTVYPVILLDRITRWNGGYRLLETVNRVRTDTGAFDPLLFVSASRRVPPGALPPGALHRQVVWRAADSARAHRSWCRRFASDSRARRPTAWYLPIQFSTPDESTQDRLADPVDEELLVVRRPPVWARTGVLTLAAAVVAGVAGAAVYVRADAANSAALDWSKHHCLLSEGDPQAKYLRTIGDECIGLSAEPLPMTGSPDMREAERVIARQNTEAEEKHKNDPDRPYCTVVYLSEMSTATDLQQAEVERLQGIAAQQRRQLDGTRADPLIRIVFANAGREMRHHKQVVDSLTELMKQDETIIGVVGLAVSGGHTAEAIQALGAAGVPMIAAPLTADELPGMSPLYYQVSPQNRREAQVAVRYAREELRLSGPVTVVAPDAPADFYAASLQRAVSEEFAKAGFAVRTVVYTPTPEVPKPGQVTPRTMGQQLCGTPGLIFYTGRPADFAQMLDGMNGTCNSSPPRILTGDDVSRYVADSKSRQRFSQIPFDYLSLALGDQSCYSGGDLNNTLRQLFPNQCSGTINPSLDGHAALAYDALAGFVNAVKGLSGIKITPGAVWHMISRTTGATRIDGASGIIDYGREGSQVPLDKFLAVMRVRDGGTPVVVASCGSHRDRSPASWCP